MLRKLPSQKLAYLVKLIDFFDELKFTHGSVAVSDFLVAVSQQNL